MGETNEGEAVQVKNMEKTNEGETIQISMKIPRELYKEFLTIKEEEGFVTLSELFRKVLRDYISRHRARRRGAQA